MTGLGVGAQRLHLAIATGLPYNVIPTLWQFLPPHLSEPLTQVTAAIGMLQTAIDSLQRSVEEVRMRVAVGVAEVSVRGAVGVVEMSVRGAVGVVKVSVRGAVGVVKVSVRGQTG